MIEVRLHWKYGGLDVEMPAVPRIGETVIVCGDLDVEGVVTKVEHNIYKRYNGERVAIIVSLEV